MEFQSALGGTFRMCEKYETCYSYSGRLAVCNEAEGKMPDGSTCKILENFDVWMEKYYREAAAYMKQKAKDLEEMRRLPRRKWNK